MKREHLYKLTLSGIFAALASLAFFIESLFPPIIVPGARLGISNVFVLLTAILAGNGYAFAVLTAKILIGSAFSGGLSALMYSFPAGVLSLTVQVLLLNRRDRFGIIAISIFGATINSLTQNAVFCLITASPEFMIYSPYLALISIVTGAAVGYTVYLVVRFLPDKYFICPGKKRISDFKT